MARPRRRCCRSNATSANARRESTRETGSRATGPYSATVNSADRSLPRPQRGLGGLERPRHALGPHRLPRLVPDEVLANLDLDVRQSAHLAVLGDGVIGLVADEVGLVVGE